MITIPVAGDHRSGLGLEVQMNKELVPDGPNSVENSISAADVYMRDTMVNCNQWTRKNFFSA